MSYSNSVELSNTISVNLLERKSNLFSVFLSTVRKPLSMFSVEYPNKGINPWFQGYRKTKVVKGIWKKTFYKGMANKIG